LWKDDPILEKKYPKVRIVARGDKETNLINYYSPVASMTGFRIFIVLAGRFKFKIRQLDVSTAFLNGRLSEPVYLDLPLGHPERRGNSKVWCSYTAIYGLARAPKIWNEHIHQFLLQFGCVNLVSEPCLYVKFQDDKIELLILLYVDDILYSGKESSVISFERLIKQKYTVKQKSQATQFIGIGLNQQGSSLLVNHMKHISEAADKFEVMTMRRFHTPIDEATLEVGESPFLTDIRMYRSIVGMLNYLCNGTRPDCSYAVGVLSRRLVKPTVADLHKAKRVLKYMYDTRHLSMTYMMLKKGSVVIEMYTDSSWANGENRKSVGGHIIYVNRNVVLFKSKQQSLVCLFVSRSSRNVVDSKYFERIEATSFEEHHL